MEQHQLSEMSLEAERLRHIFSCVKIFLRGCVILIAIWIIMHYLSLIVVNSPENLSALAKVIEALRVGQLLGYIGMGISSFGWYVERRGKKRAIKKASRLQKKLEANDPQRTSSGLTDEGDTPEEDY